ncbi:MAG: dUTP diphosphatase [bacterium]|nr:dUTP diphosphatase [bacterium]
MRVKIKRLNPTLPLPDYHTSGACAFDLYARETTVVPAHGYQRVPTNFIIKVPKGYALFISLRSGTPKKFNLLLPNAPGLIDQDYFGPEDEILVAVYNYGVSNITLERGVRFAQGTFVKIDRADWQEVGQVASATRGGFGSTG